MEWMSVTSGKGGRCCGIMKRCSLTGESCNDRQERGMEQMADCRSVSRLLWCNEHSPILTNEGGKGHVGLCDFGI